MLELRPWTLPLIVAAIVVPVVAGFAVAGPPLGMAVGFVATATLVLIAARQRPGGTIATATATDTRRHVLIVLSRELDDPAALDRITLEGRLEDTDADVLVLAPAKTRVLDRWATDVGPARAEAQRKLVISVATLGTAEVAAEARVGDDDIVRAVEDQLRTFPAGEVILVTGSGVEDPDGERAASELAGRLSQPLLRIVVGEPGGGGQGERVPIPA
jgi:hypothetical protein